MAALLGFWTILGQMALLSTVVARLILDVRLSLQAVSHELNPCHLELWFWYKNPELPRKSCCTVVAFWCNWRNSCTFPGRFLIYSKYWSPSLMRTSCSWAAITEASNIEWKDSISVCTSLTMSGKWSDFLTRNLIHWSRYPKASDLESRENSFLIKRRSSKPFDSVMPKAEIWLLIKFSILLYPVKFCWSKWKSLLLLMVWSWSLKDRIGSAELMASFNSGP